MNEGYIFNKLFDWKEKMKKEIFRKKSQSKTKIYMITTTMGYGKYK